MTFRSCQKVKRVSDRALLDRIKSLPCVVCGSGPCDPCHIKTVGSGGPDVEENVVSMCRIHHEEQGTIGFWLMAKKYIRFKWVLEEKGWIFEGKRLTRR